MTDERMFRAALADLAAADAPPLADPGAVRGRARVLRRRRRANTAVAASLLSVVALAGAFHPHGERNGLRVAHDPTPTATAPTPSPEPSTAPSETPPAGGQPRPSATYAPSPGPSATPSDRPTNDPTAEPTTPSPAAAPPESTPPRPAACRLLVDQRKDSALLAASEDITSGDVASDDAAVHAVLRVDDLSSADPNGSTWSFGWTLGTTSYAFVATRDTNGTVRPSLVVTPNGGNASTVNAVTVVLDTTANEVRWSTARSNVQDLATATTFTGLRADTSTGTSPAMAADAAQSQGTYEDRTPSCID